MKKTSAVRAPQSAPIKSSLLFIPPFGEELWSGLGKADGFLYQETKGSLSSNERFWNVRRFNFVPNKFYVGLMREMILMDAHLKKDKYSSSSTLEIRILIRKKKSPTRSPKLDALFLGLFSSHSFIYGAGWSPSRQIPTIMTLEQNKCAYQSQLIALY